MIKFSTIAALCVSCIATSASAYTVFPVTIGATDAIYNADAPYAYSTTNPVDLTLPSGASYFTFVNPSGSLIDLNGRNVNDADGFGAAVSSSSNTGTATISGISAPNAGYIVGVFLNINAIGAAPTALTYTSTNAASYAPLLQQVFFVGDGLTGDDSGTLQQFVVPTGATDLFLGISDASGYNGSPGSYGDNSGALFGVVGVFTNAVVTPPTGGTVPEPSDVALFGLGVAALVARRRNARCE